MASRPVDWMALTMADGAAVPVTVRVCVGREASMVATPGSLASVYRQTYVHLISTPSSLHKAAETSSTHDAQCMGTAKVVWNAGIILVAVGEVSQYI